MAKQPGSDWGSITSFGGKVSSVFKGAGSGGARVRANTNAASSIKKSNPATSMSTDIIQKRSVKEVSSSKSPAPLSTPKKTVKPAEIKAGGKKAFKPKQRTNGLTDAEQRKIDEARLSRFDWR